MAEKVLYVKEQNVAHITLNRPEVKNAIDFETHQELCRIWADFRDDPSLRIAVLSGTGDTFTAGADLKTHSPDWQMAGPMIGRERIDVGLSGITRGPLARINKPIIASIDGWCIGHGVELAMACDIRVASDRAQFAEFQVRKGMHHADGGISRLVNVCGVGFALEMLLVGGPVSAQRAYAAGMLSQVVPPEDLPSTVAAMVARILENDQAAIESAKETILEIIGRPLYDQLRVEAMWGYALCAGNPSIAERTKQFFER